MEQHEAGELPGSRPYRSHKLPACTVCRQRKGRCHVDDPTLPCRYCRRKSLTCDHGLNSKKLIRRHQTQQHGPQHQSPITQAPTDSPRRHDSSLVQMSFGEMQTLDDSSPIMVNPTMAEDLDVLERHLAPRNVAEVAEAQPYVRISNTLDESIVYRTVPRIRKGLQSTSSPGVRQREIMENVLGELHVAVIQL